jgi:hypothetical protein
VSVAGLGDLILVSKNMALTPLPQICRGQVHASRKERIRIIIIKIKIKIIIRNGAKPISLP